MIESMPFMSFAFTKCKLFSYEFAFGLKMWIDKENPIVLNQENNRVFVLQSKRNDVALCRLWNTQISRWRGKKIGCLIESEKFRFIVESWNWGKSIANGGMTHFHSIDVWIDWIASCVSPLIVDRDLQFPRRGNSKVFSPFSFPMAFRYSEIC